MTRRGWLAASVLGLAVLAAFPAAARAAPIPVRIRIIKGSRQGPPSLDPRLSDLASQLGHLAYQRWEQVGEQRADMDPGKSVSVPLPAGGSLQLKLVEVRGDTATFEVRLPASRGVSRLTISKDQRIVHQVADEKAGEAYFATVRPWP